MRSLLRADWLRFRRRIDLWLIGAGVLVILGVVYLVGFQTESTYPSWPSASEIRDQVVAESEGAFEGLTQAEIDAEIERMVAERTATFDEDRRQVEAQRLAILQKYDVVQSPFTLVGFGFLPLIALIFTTTLVLGDEFRYGTIRTSLLAASSRRRYLVARLITFTVTIVGLFAVMIVLSVVLAVVLRVIGGGAQSSPPLNAQASVALLASELLVAFTLVAFGVALTLVTRSGSIPLLIILIWALAELLIFNLSVFQAGQPLGVVPQFFLTTNIRTLFTTLGTETGAVALLGNEIPSPAIAIPTWGAAAIIAAWAILFLAVADRRFRTMDITE